MTSYLNIMMEYRTQPCARTIASSMGPNNQETCGGKTRGREQESRSAGRRAVVSNGVAARGGEGGGATTATSKPGQQSQCGRRQRQQKTNPGNHQSKSRNNSPQQKNNRRQRARQAQRSPCNAVKADNREGTSLKQPSQLTCCSIDSGRGEELSSSCESSFEPKAITLECRSRHSSCSDLDDVFMDALSNIPSEDDDYSSITSSAFVTPFTSRSQSPTNFEKSTEQNVSLLLSPMELYSSLERVQDEQNTTEQESGESHVTSPDAKQPDHVTSPLDEQLDRVTSPVAKQPDHVTSPLDEQLDRVTSPVAKQPDHVTSPLDEQLDHVTPPVEQPDDVTMPVAKQPTSPVAKQPDHVTSESPLTTSEEGSKSKVSPERTGFYIGDVELEIDNEQENEALSFEFQACTASKSDTDCSSGSLSPAKVSRRKAPHTLLTVDTSQYSFSSISTASPRSSVCSHSSSHPPSPLPLSPSPTSHCEEKTEDNSLERRHQKDKDVTDPSGKVDLNAEPEVVSNLSLHQEDPTTGSPHVNDEWPDLGENSYLQQQHQEQRTDVTTSPNFVQWYSPVITTAPHYGIHPAVFHYVPTVIPSTTGYAVPYCTQQTYGYASFVPHSAPPVYFTNPESTSEAIPCHSQKHNHPLHATWVMWYDKIRGNCRNQMADYQASLNHISTIGCVEDFWRLYNNICLPSELDKNANYHFFKHNINPLWEDPANKHGGKWVLTVKDNVDILDRVWIELLLALIGEHMDRSNLVNGAVVSRRKKGDRISLWTTKRAKKANLNICKELIKVLALACEIPDANLPRFVQQLAEGGNGLSLVYMHHSDSLKSGTSYQNDARIFFRDHWETILESC